MILTTFQSWGYSGTHRRAASHCNMNHWYDNEMSDVVFRATRDGKGGWEVRTSDGRFYAVTPKIPWARSIIVNTDWRCIKPWGELGTEILNSIRAARGEPPLRFEQARGARNMWGMRSRELRRDGSDYVSMSEAVNGQHGNRIREKKVRQP